MKQHCKFLMCPMTIEIIVPGSVDGGAGKVCEEVVLPLDAAGGGGGGVAHVVPLAAPAPVEHVLRRTEPARQVRVLQNGLFPLLVHFFRIRSPPTKLLNRNYGKGKAS